MGPTYSVTQKHTVLSVPSDGSPTGRTLALRKVDAVGQYHSNMWSSTALSQSHDTTRGAGCPILATQPSPPTQSPKNTQCSACPPNGAATGRTLALRKADAAGQQHGDMRSAAALSQSHGTTRGVGGPILATQPSPPTQSPKNTQCSACPPNGAATGRTLA